MISATAAYVYGFMELAEYIRHRTEGETMTGTPAETITAYAGWAKVEIMGHRMRIGRIAEVEMYGGKMLRIDIPTDGGDVTEFYSGPSIFSILPISEEVAYDAVKHCGDPRPVKPVEYQPRPQLTNGQRDASDDDEFYDNKPF